MRKEYPNKIYLQIETCDGDKIEPKDLYDCEATWSQDRINESDLVFTRNTPSEEEIFKIIVNVYTKNLMSNDIDMPSKVFTPDKMHELAKAIVALCEDKNER